MRLFCDDAPEFVPTSVALVGRPNVGKSTLFNRLVGKRLAMVHNTPGVTRDWKDGTCEMFGHAFTLTDTAGLQAPERGDDAMVQMLGDLTTSVVSTADLVVLVVDGRVGVTTDDERIAEWLRPVRNGQPVMVVATKCENDVGEDVAIEAARLGYGIAVRVSAEHNEGIQDMGRELLPVIREQPEGQSEDPKEMIVSVVGVPNVGKSTLVNAICGEQRMLVGDTPGLTRETNSTKWDLGDGKFARLLDTAGLQAHRTIGKDRLSLLSRWDTERAIAMSDVVVLVIDANLPFTRRDLTIAHQVVDKGKALVVAANKLDSLPSGWATRAKEVEEHIEQRMEKELSQLFQPRVVALSALQAKGIPQLLSGINASHSAWTHRISTSLANQWLQMIQHSPAMRWPAGLNLKFMAQTSIKPPTFTLFYNMTKSVLSTAQKRRITKALCNEFSFFSTPVRLLLRKNDKSNTSRKINTSKTTKPRVARFPMSPSPRVNEKSGK